MLQLFFTVAFSAVPLTLYVPPMRSLNLFVETIEYVVRESTTYRNRVYPRIRVAWSRMLDLMLCNTSPLLFNNLNSQSTIKRVRSYEFVLGIVVVILSFAQYLDRNGSATCLHFTYYWETSPLLQGMEER
ncbi:hypothetical protein CR513_05109, partial [Mucuna pruriens]